MRADGTRLTTGTSAAPDPPRHNDAPTPTLQYAGDRDQRRRRDNDRRDRDRDRRDHGGRGGGGGRGQVHFEKDKGTPCLTSIITHLIYNCGGADINSTYRQCLVSMRNSTTYLYLVRQQGNSEVVGAAAAWGHSYRIATR